MRGRPRGAMVSVVGLPWVVRDGLALAVGVEHFAHLGELAFLGLEPGSLACRTDPDMPCVICAMGGSRSGHPYLAFEWCDAPMRELRSRTGRHDVIGVAF